MWGPATTLHHQVTCYIKDTSWDMSIFWQPTKWQTYMPDHWQFSYRIRKMCRIAQVHRTSRNIKVPLGSLDRLGTDTDKLNPDLYPQMTHPYGSNQIWILNYRYLQINGYIRWYESYDTMWGIGPIGDTDRRRTRRYKSHTLRKTEGRERTNTGDTGDNRAELQKLQVETIGRRYRRQSDRRHGQSQIFLCMIDSRPKRGKRRRSWRPFSETKGRLK